MTKILIVYSSGEGQTKKIATFIKEKMSAHNCSADIFDCEKINSYMPLFNYDGFLIGASVHRGKFSNRIEHWISENRLVINSKPSAFFSVCLGILEKGSDALISESNIVIDFFEKTNWYPSLWRIFAGALKYSKYNWFLKKVMQRIAAKSGFSSDIKHDYEFTDWNDVEAFVEQFLDKVISAQSKKISLNKDIERTLG